MWILINFFHSFPLLLILENEITIDDGYFGIRSKWDIYWPLLFTTYLILTRLSAVVEKYLKY